MSSEHDELDGLIIDAALASPNITVSVDEEGNLFFGALDGHELTIPELLDLMDLDLVPHAWEAPPVAAIEVVEPLLSQPAVTNFQRAGVVATTVTALSLLLSVGAFAASSPNTAPAQPVSKAHLVSMTAVSPQQPQTSATAPHAVEKDPITPVKPFVATPPARHVVAVHAVKAAPQKAHGKAKKHLLGSKKSRDAKPALLPLLLKRSVQVVTPVVNNTSAVLKEL